jgi:hypothetical protein
MTPPPSHSGSRIQFSNKCLIRWTIVQCVRVSVCRPPPHKYPPAMILALIVMLTALITILWFYKVNAMFVYIPCGLILEPEDMALGGGGGRVQ